MKKRFYLVLAILFLASAVAVFFWILNIKKLNSLKTENETMAREISNVNIKAEKIKNVENTLNEFKEKNEIINDIIVNKDNFINLIEDIESAASSTNIDLDIKSAAMDADPVLNMNLEGNFEDISRFIEILENFKFASSFNRIVIQKDSALNIWSAQIDLKILSFSDVY